MKKLLRHPVLRRLPRHLMPWAVFALSLLLTCGVSLLLKANVRARDEARFENLVQAASDRIQRRLDTYVALLEGTEGLFATQHDVTPTEFSEFVQLLRVQIQYPGIQGIGFSRRFSPQERPEVEHWARTKGAQPDFHVWPEVPGDELHSIVFLEPRDARNQAAMGYNMYSEPTRREAMARARDTGRPALTAKVTLKQEIHEEKQAGFLLYLPVYRGGRVPATVEGRREELVGFVYSPFRAGDLLRGIFGTERQPRVAFELYDGPAVDPENLLHRSSGARPLPDAPMFTTTTRLTVAGRPWTLTFASLPVFTETAAGRLVLPVSMAGVLVSLAFFFMSLAQVRARREAERSADGLRVALGERARVEEQLREADRRKDDFLAMLAHELRNPLAPVLTAVQLMERKLEEGQDIGRERDVVERQVHHMRRLVDDLLDVSRVTRGKIQLQKRPVELVAAVGRALEAARPFSESRAHTLSARLPLVPVWTEADPVRLEQVFTNLLHNAAKYSERGGRITLSLAREGGEAVVRVEDTGMGIPAEALPHLFEPFMQVARTLDRAQGGLGLGLTLVKQLVEMHGGRVEAASEGVGRGSVFTVRLPLLPEARVPVEPEDARPEREMPSARRRVLVVDDNVDAAELLGEVLELDGHQVTVVHDGPAALELVGGVDPDVVFLDIGLPGMDGYEVARRMRQRPGGADLMLVALTGYGQASDRQRSHEAGFDTHLVKPVELDTVRALVADAERPSRPRPGRAADGRSEGSFRG
ncbi:CHASE domain-containing protein [Archangium violaceum]|uniref:CHASE domain-containing protein n=1 Tax=Archangium violaceum TaxID=83451 RepID=UPI00194DC8C1|nr:CHASE domain-containing protein [Archangium violaceum]QRN96579.1 CHASE domain-containing protein [Archangium violaceum]